MLKGFIALVFGASVLASSALADHVPSTARIRSISYAGTGCPAGTLSGYFLGGLDGFKLEFDSFVAEAGQGVPMSEQRKNCAVFVDLEFPSGWSFAIAEVEHRGYVDLDSGVTATQQTSYYFQGQPSTATLRTTVTGPVARDYTIRDVLGIESLVWSPCGARRGLVMNAQVRVDNSRARWGSGLITLDSLEGHVEHLYGVKWRRCR